jgi:hypothetical protein
VIAGLSQVIIPLSLAICIVWLLHQYIHRQYIPQVTLKCGFDPSDPGCVRPNTIQTLLHGAFYAQRSCTWYRVKVDAENGNCLRCRALLLSLTRDGIPLIPWETLPLPIVHAEEDGTKTIHEGITDHIDLLAVFDNNTVDLCVPLARRMSSINWNGLFSVAGLYQLKVAITSPDGPKDTVDVRFRWTLNRTSSEIA